MKKKTFKSKVKRQKAKVKSKGAITFFTFYFLLLTLVVCTVHAQTTEFTYQGKLNVSGTAASSPHDIEFRLCASDTGDCTSAPVLIGTDTHSNVTVANGIFSVRLNFTAPNAFDGSARWLEIRVKLNGSPDPYQLLSPRQPLTSAPYAVKALNADTATNSSQLGGVAANQYVTTATGGTNFIQNNPASQQAGSFNVNGNGTAGGTLSGNIVTAATQFNIGANRVLTSGLNNLYAGVGAGITTSSGDNNSFFGTGAGGANSNGSNNTFLGNGAGSSNTLGSNNTMLGAGANVLSPNLNFATAIGAGATIIASNTIVLGRSGGLDTVAIPGNTLMLGNLNVSGSMNGNGSGLSSLNAGNFTSGILPFARGGTGLSTPGSSGNFLRSDGTNWTSSALQASDIPAGSGNYIQNTTFAQTSSNFNITGNGTIGGTLRVIGTGVLGDPPAFLALPSGNVGIGVDNPDARLHVGGNVIVNPASGFATVGIRNATSTDFAQLQILDDTQTYRGYIGYMGANAPFGATRNDTVEVGTNGKDLTFRPNETEAMRIKTTGNVGIGTLSPASRLHLNGNSNNFALTFTNQANTVGSRGYRIAFDNDRLGFQKADDAGAFLGHQVTISQATGNVGIGTTDPGGNKLYVAGNVRLDGALSLNGNQGQAGQVMTSNGAAVPQWKSPTNQLFQQTTMSVDSGSTSPPENLALPIPGLVQTISTSGNAKLLIQFNVYLNRFCTFGCGITDPASVYVNVNGVMATRVSRTLPGYPVNTFFSGDFLGGSWVQSVGSGDHTIEIAGGFTGSGVTFGGGGSFNKSNLIVQVIPE
ncbi:MAG: hypothetical protein ACKVRN_01625 [Pyrinomonadaceae bacterium]